MGLGAGVHTQHSLPSFVQPWVSQFSPFDLRFMNCVVRRLGKVIYFSSDIWILIFIIFNNLRSSRLTLEGSVAEEKEYVL